jgi:hypothetical protein
MPHAHHLVPSQVVCDDVTEGLSLLNEGIELLSGVAP